jgi:hypothetical protein
MATERQGPQGQPAERRDDPQPPTQVHSCTRIGRAANPPRARLGGWLRRRAGS